MYPKDSQDLHFYSIHQLFAERLDRMGLHDTRLDLHLVQLCFLYQHFQVNSKSSFLLTVNTEHLR